MNKVRLGAIASTGLLATSPAFAQIPAGGMPPTAMVTAAAVAILSMFAGTAVMAGSFKAWQAWVGSRNPYELLKIMGIGLVLGGGTAAVVGFAG